MRRSCIRLEKVTATIEGISILKDITLEVPEGMTTVIMGLSGSGKSTLLKVMNGLKEIEKGRIIFGEEEITRLSHERLLSMRRQTAFVFQDAALWANMSLLQNLTLPVLQRDPSADRQALLRRIERMCEEFLFDDDLSLRPSQISLGERKIASFMRALLVEPRTIFLDEPTSSVDPAVCERMIQRLRKEKRKGVTIIAATNDPRVCANLADEVIILKEGRLVETGSLSEVIRSTNPETIEALSDVLSQAASYDMDILSLLDGEDLWQGDSP